MGTVMSCESCPHPVHAGECGAPITEDIRVARYPFDPVGSYFRTLVVDNCGCGYRPDEEGK